MSGEDRQSQLAREHKERQAQRAEQATKTKRNTFIGAGAAIVVVVGGLVAATALLGGNGDGKPEAASSPAPSDTPEPSAPVATPSIPADPAKMSCSYRKDTSGSPAKKVGMPPSKPNLKLKTMTVATSQGDIVIDLMTQTAPCAVNSLAFLAKKNFYDNTKCHRLATPENSAGLSLLQCGDPQAKADGKNPTDGQGSAGYVFNDEIPEGVKYARGVVSLAQPADAGNQNGSQFWISLGGENEQLPPAYTPFGFVTKGMDLLDKVAKGGWITNPEDITGDGGSNAPKIPVLIKDVRIS